MGEFIEIFKKVDGWGQLKEYKKSHVLIFALTETAILGTSRKSLEIVRLAVQNRIFQRLKKQNAKLVEQFVKDHPCQEKFEHRKTIWTIWLQGMDKAPKMVQRCYESMKEHIHDREIVVITEDNYSDYVCFPDYIMRKYKAGIISKVHFADLLRVELLTQYGGTWLDGTVFCSGFISGKHDFYLNSDLFLFQDLKPGFDGHAAAISSWMITASAKQNIMLLTRELLHNYWRNHDYAVDYFILHDFFQIAIDAYPDEWKKVIPVSNSIPHILLLRLFDEYDDNVWKTVSDMTPFHKLTHKYQVEQEHILGTYFDVIVNENQEIKNEKSRIMCSL